MQCWRGAVPVVRCTAYFHIPIDSIDLLYHRARAKRQQKVGNYYSNERTCCDVHCVHSLYDRASSVIYFMCDTRDADAFALTHPSVDHKFCDCCGWLLRWVSSANARAHEMCTKLCIGWRTCGIFFSLSCIRLLLYYAENRSINYLL